MSPKPRHVPVLPDKVLEMLAPQVGQTIVDCTVGVGGHARLIAQRLGPQGLVIGLDQDEAMLEQARRQLAGLPAKLIHANFDQLRPVLNQLGIEGVDGVLADLGVCSDQLDDAQRGLSFREPGLLDMRLDRSVGQPASELLEKLSDRDLAEVFWKFGEERFSRRIAWRIVERRQRMPLRTTEELADLVRSCVPRSRGHGIDPATRVFQALRIAVNDELGALERLLAALPVCLKSGGRAVVISFHSLEDRLVKRVFRNRAVCEKGSGTVVRSTLRAVPATVPDPFSHAAWQELTRKPVQASDEEIRDNPRARSAKLRAAIWKPNEQEERNSS